MKRFIILVFFIVFIVSGCKSYCEKSHLNVINTTAKMRIDSMLKETIESATAAGISALIVEKNTEVYYNALGFADKEKGKKMDRNTIFRIFSLTKPITGVALMQLYEKGLFKLDDPLYKYIPEFQNLKVFVDFDKKEKMILEPLLRPITIRDLTRHTAGFANAWHKKLGKMVNDADLYNKETTLKEMVLKLAKIPLAFQPGEKWSYDICVDVQAYLVEYFSKIPFDKYIKENILDPLEMNETSYVLKDVDRLAITYKKDNDGNLVRVEKLQNRDYLAMNTKKEVMTPGGFGLTTTVDDYMKFARMLVNKGLWKGLKILKPETVNLMATNHMPDNTKDLSFLPTKGQLGFGIDFAVRVRPPATKEENNGVVGEFFWDGAASTLFWVDPVNELTAVLFLQVFPFSSITHKKFRDAVYGEIK